MLFYLFLATKKFLLFLFRIGLGSLASDFFPHQKPDKLPSTHPQKRIRSFDALPQLPSTHFAIALSPLLSHPPKHNHAPKKLHNATLAHRILASISHPPPPLPPQMAAKLAYFLTPARTLTAPFTKPIVSLSSTSSSCSSSASFPGVHSVPLVGCQFCFRRRLFILSPRATTDQPG